MQNTMVMGGGDGKLEKKIKIRSYGEKNEKGERKKEENYIKKVKITIKKGEGS